jgi:hypothetical protein
LLEDGQDRGYVADDGIFLSKDKEGFIGVIVVD